MKTALLAFGFALVLAGCQTATYYPTDADIARIAYANEMAALQESDPAAYQQAVYEDQMRRIQAAQLAQGVANAYLQQRAAEDAQFYYQQQNFQQVQQAGQLQLINDNLQKMRTGW